jgi:hypothetical protein
MVNAYGRRASIVVPLTADQSPEKVQSAERLHAAGVLVKQVAQVRRWTLRIGDCQEHG